MGEKEESKINLRFVSVSDWVVIPLMGKEMEKKGKAGRREKNEAFNSEHTASEVLLRHP